MEEISNYNDDIHKMKMIEILKKDLSLEKKEIIDFMSVSESSYNKMVSSSNRQLPQKSIMMLEKLFSINNWDLFLEDLPNKKDYVLKIIKFNRFHIQKTKKFIEEEKDKEKEILKSIKNMYFISSFVENQSIQEIPEEDLELLSEFAKTKRFAKNMESYIRIGKFKTTGDIGHLKKEDFAYIGFVESLHNHDEYEDVLYKKGLKKAKQIEEKIKTEIDIFQ